MFSIIFIHARYTNEYLWRKFVRYNNFFFLPSFCSFSETRILVYICRPFPELENATPKNQLYFTRRLKISCLSVSACALFLMSMSITWKPPHASNALLPIGLLPSVEEYTTRRSVFLTSLYFVSCMKLYRLCRVPICPVLSRIDLQNVIVLSSIRA